MKSVVFIFFFICQNTVAQNVPVKKVYISLSEMKPGSYDTLHDGSNVLVLENVDSTFATSTAMLTYWSESKFLIQKKYLKKAIKFDSLISIIKNSKLDFMDKFQFYIIDRNSKGQYVAYKVGQGDYFESKDKTGLDILSDF